MRWSRPFWVLLAVIVLVETWLWDHVGAWLRRLADLIPFARLKAALVAGIEKLPPLATLLVFVVPAIVLFPFKLAGLALIARGHVVLGFGTFFIAKSIGVGLAAFLFQVCKPKLMQLRGFVWIYDHWLIWAAWAHHQIDPIKAEIKARLAPLKARILAALPQGRGKIARFARRIRPRSTLEG